MQRVGITELAKELGVNIATVSRALNDKAGVSDELRQRIRKRALELDYQPNAFARALLTNRTSMIGVIGGTQSTSLFDNAYWSQVLAGIEEGARAAGYDLLIGSSEICAENGKTLLPNFLSKRSVDGILALNSISEAVSKALQSSQVPCVQIDFRDRRDYPAVVTDHLMGAYVATRHLIDLGHKNLLFVGNAWKHPNFRLRQKGFWKAVEEAGIKGADLTRSEASHITASLAEDRDLLLGLLRKNPKVTGIVFQNDEAAVNAKTVLMNEGIKIPEQISLIGFDDTILARITYPPLSTMRVQKHQMGRAAFDILLNSLSGALPGTPQKPSLIKFQAELLVRGTTAPPLLSREKTR